MSFLIGISELINDDFLIKGKTLIGEADCEDIEINGKHVIIQADHKNLKDNVINTIFNPGQARCVSDYIIVSDEIILVCELKSNNEGNMKTQLKNTGKFIKYLLEMVKDHNKIKQEIPPIKFVCFAKNNFIGNRNTHLIFILLNIL